MIFKLSVLVVLAMGLAVVLTDVADDLDCSKAVADVILILDSSVGVGAENFARKTSLAMKAVREFTISRDRIQIGAVLVSSAAIKWFYLNKFSDADSVVRAIELAPYLPGERDTAAALDLALNDGFSSCHGARPNVSRIVVAFLDGPSADSAAAEASAKRLRDSGVVTIFVGVDNTDHNSLVTLAGDASNVIETCSYGQFGNEIRIRLAQEICEATVKTTLPPGVKAPPVTTTAKPKCLTGDEQQCQHICTETATSFTCSCRDGYVVNAADPTKCDIIPCTTHSQADIFFVVDSSDSIGEKGYNQALAFLIHIIQAFIVGPLDIQVGCIVYSWDVVDLLHLDNNKTKEEIQQTIREAPYLRSSTFTHKAFNVILTKRLFDPENGGRNNVSKIIVLLTDGKSNIKDLTLRFAKEVKKQNIRIITIGVGNAIDKKELNAVASDDKSVFYVAGYNVLDTIETQITKTTCEG